MNLVKFVIDLIFPVECLGCGRPDVWVCGRCFKKIKLDPKIIEGLAGLDGVYCAAGYRQEMLEKILHCFKYRFIRELGDTLSRLPISLIKGLELDERLKIDLVTAVPLARKRKNWRGFNQSEVLAEAVSRNFNWRFEPDIIYRTRNAHPQVGLKAEERLKNLKNVFGVRAQDIEIVKNKNILIIDDVLTTGATLSESASALKKAGAKAVYGLVLAKS